MRANSKKRTTLLVTEDPAVETTVRIVAEKMGHRLRRLTSNQDAMCVIADACASESVVIVDLDSHSGRRSLLNTAGGMLPVIAVSEQAPPWLNSMLRRKRIWASLPKPLQLAALAAALSSAEAPCGAFADPVFGNRSKSSLNEVFEADFRNISMR
jgi:DNA-binding NtrC family response regulator